LRHGGFTTGGFNFDTKVRRQSSDAVDLFYGHIGAIDALALALERAAEMIESDTLAAFKAQRYAGWDDEFGKRILSGGYSLQSLAEEAVRRDLRPAHVSGRQEYLENLVNRFIFR
jgi:xylose isomerase